MTISNQSTGVSYNGNSSQTNFAIPFDFQTNSEVKVILASSLGVEALQISGTNYSITPDPGTTVVMAVAPATGQKLIIKRSTANTQITDFIGTAAFDSEANERALDKLTRVDQELTSSLARALLFKDSAGTTGIGIDALSANSTLIVNPAGNGLIMGPNLTNLNDALAAAVAAAASAVAAATSAGAASVSASNAATSATSASTSASNASSSATSATNSASQASTSATAAASSASSASTSATSAATSATAAASSASSAAAVVASATSANTASAIVKRDSSSNAYINSINETVAVTATAGTITTLTSASAPTQIFTGTLAQTVLLPAGSSYSQTGAKIRIINQSTAIITVQDSAGASITQANVATLSTKDFVCTSTSGAGTWVFSRVEAPLVGDVTSVGAITTIGANKVLNSMLAQMPTATLKGNITGGTSNATDITAAQAKALLSINYSDITGLGTAATEDSSHFALAMHTHAESDITNLVTDLAGKAPIAAAVPVGGTTGQQLAKLSGTNYDIAWVDATAATIWGAITGTLSDQTDLQSSLNGKVNNTGDETIAGNKTFSDVLSFNGVLRDSSSSVDIYNNGYLQASTLSGAFGAVTIGGTGGSGAWINYDGSAMLASGNYTVASSGNTVIGSITLNADGTASFSNSNEFNILVNGAFNAAANLFSVDGNGNTVGATVTATGTPGFIGDGSALTNIPNPFDQSLNTSGTPAFNSLSLNGTLNMNSYDIDMGNGMGSGGGTLNLDNCTVLGQYINFYQNTGNIFWQGVSMYMGYSPGGNSGGQLYMGGGPIYYDTGGSLMAQGGNLYGDGSNLTNVSNPHIQSINFNGPYGPFSNAPSVNFFNSNVSGGNTNGLSLMDNGSFALLGSGTSLPFFYDNTSGFFAGEVIGFFNGNASIDPGGNVSAVSFIGDGSTLTGINTDVQTALNLKANSSAVSARVASNNLTGQTAANASVTTYTPAALGTFRVGGYLTITAVAVDVIQMQVTYTDETSTARTQIFFPQGLTSANLATTGAYNFPPMDIRAAASAITVKTVLTTGAGSITYDVGATIFQLE